MLKIGVIAQDIETESLGIELQQILKNKSGIESTVSISNNLQDIWNCIRSTQISILAYPLTLLPTALPNGIVITALNQRKNASNSLIISRSNVDDTQFLSLKKGTRVGFQNEISRVQFQTFEVNCVMETQEMTPSEVKESLENGHFEAYVLPTECLSFLDFEEGKYHTVPFNPKEYIPLAGQGVTAYLVDEDDLTTRRILKTAFQDIKLPTGQSIATVTNVERRVKQLFNDAPLAVYCEIDRAKNYHLLAAAIINGELKKVRISQSTSFELAERCFEKLNS